MHKIAPVWKWLFIILLAIIAVAAAFHFDSAVRAWVIEHSNRTAKQFMRNVSRYGDWPEHILAGLLLVAIAWWRGNKRWVRIGLTMILACALAGIAARGLKITTGRARPSVKQELGWNGPRLNPKYNSFPSGHTAATTAFFGVLFFANRRLAALLSTDPVAHRRVAHVCRGALFVGCDLRCNHRDSVCLALRQGLPQIASRPRKLADVAPGSPP